MLSIYRNFINAILLFIVLLMIKNVIAGYFNGESQSIGDVNVPDSNREIFNNYQRKSLHQVAHSDLMGKYINQHTEPAVLPQKPKVVPETKLKLTLRGILNSEDGSEAIVIIAEGNGKERIYKVGMKVANQATIHEVYSDHIVLMRNNQLEKLMLVDVDSNAKTQRIRPVVKPKVRRSQSI